MQLETELADRILRFDGISIVHPEKVAEAIARGVSPRALRLSDITEEIQQFNENVAEEDRLLPADSGSVSIQMAWQLPQEYLDMNLEVHIATVYGDRCAELYEKYTQEEYDESIQRVAAELEEIKVRGMVEFMKTIIYVLDTLRKNNIIWGVGRGSSCACYILYLLGLHAVDCVKFKVPMNEFFHD